MGKQERSLPTDEALRRAERITPLLASDMWYALRAGAALHIANDVVHERDFDRPNPHSVVEDPNGTRTDPTPAANASQR
jgi:hypothetical protein